ncbi:PAS domain-containing sensor histidine kinase [Paenibacillus sp. DMB20]|uniref:PAS domain-containing sensor histidine kinase n=1 Tax=Paenibacillus sp. DMB20 TaxID=1642570 RepID=UPI00069BF40B|nr:PAS domain S-box protein [Paenibacillus sp. DMB20]
MEWDMIDSLLWIMCFILFAGLTVLLLDRRRLRSGNRVEAEITGIYDEYTDAAIHVFFDVSERKKMERALKESMERYRRLVELSPAAIAVFKDKGLIYLNPSCMKLFGASRMEEMIGSHPRSWLLEDDPDLIAACRDEILQHGFITAKELRIKRLNGGIIDIVANAIYDDQSDTVEIVFEDITERKKVEQALMESERLNRQIIEISPVAMLLHQDYRFTYANPHALLLLGAASSDEIVGHRIGEITHPDSHELVMEYVEDVYEQQGTSQLGWHRMIRRDGKVIDVEAVTAPIPFMGAKTAVTIVRDITERKKQEDDRRYAEDLVRESEDRYFRLQMSLDQFSSDSFGMIKEEDLNCRFVREVRQVIGTDLVSFIEVDHHTNVTVTHGGPEIADSILETIFELGPHQLPICELIDTLDGHFVKIGEIRGISCILCIGEPSPFLVIQATRVWLETIARYVSVLYDNFRVIGDLNRELEQIASQQRTPVWLLRLIFQLSEKERKNLAQDLHDAALQDQIVWYRKLDQLMTAPELPENLHRELEKIKQGLLDVMYQIRITCNELRPPMLRELGLERSLEGLFELTQLRSDYAIRFECSGLNHPMNDDLLIGLYRIVQEMLANASKHSGATQVVIKLFGSQDRLCLNYADNGVGMNVEDTERVFSNMGVYGIKERVRSLNGEVRLVSSPDQGLSISISIPA